MKEKIKKMFQYICTWKFVMWLNVACMVYLVVGMLVEFYDVYIAAISWHGGYALMAWILSDHEERRRDYERFISLMAQDYRKDLAKLNRYKTRYGELPPDAPQTEVPQTEDPATKELEAEDPQADAPSVADISEEPIAEPVAEPSAVSKKPRSVHRKPKRPAINPGTSHRTSSAAPKKPRTKKNKEEQV